jgi:hypothetical protein
MSLRGNTAELPVAGVGSLTTPLSSRSPVLTPRQHR